MQECRGSTKHIARCMQVLAMAVEKSLFARRGRSGGVNLAPDLGQLIPPGSFDRRRDIQITDVAFAKGTFVDVGGQLSTLLRPPQIRFTALVPGRLFPAPGSGKWPGKVTRYPNGYSPVRPAVAQLLGPMNTTCHQRPAPLARRGGDMANSDAALAGLNGSADWCS